MEPLPIVVGSSLTGLLVSHSLARRGIEHLVIGGPRPRVAPRLEAVVDEGAALACWELLGRVYRPFFHARSHVSLCYGALASVLRLADPDRDLDALDRIDPHVARPQHLRERLVHLDRARLDPVLYQEVREHPACRFIEGRVRRVAYDHDAGRVRALTLTNGHSLVPRVVFDATGYRGLVAEAARLRHRPLGRLRRTVWQHRRRTITADPPPWPWWRHGTNLLRLERQYDGIDGIAWMVPLGDELSLGLEVDARHGPDDVADAMLADTLLAAFERRGMAVAREFPRAGSVRSLVHRYYLRERAHGANWLLTGSSYGRLWFPTASSVAASVAAAHLAPAFVERPHEVGGDYAAWFRSRLPLHRLAGRLVGVHVPTRIDELQRFWARWVRATRVAVAQDLRVARGEPVTRPHGGARWGAELAELLRGTFAQVQVRRVDTPQAWRTALAHTHTAPQGAVRRYARGWALYVGSSLAGVWRREERSGFLPARADPSSVATA